MQTERLHHNGKLSNYFDAAPKLLHSTHPTGLLIRTVESYRIGEPRSLIWIKTDQKISTLLGLL